MLVRSSDAELIRICAEHIVNRDAYNNNPTCGALPYEEDPLWLAYERTLIAVSEAEPKTLAGLAAKARATKAEATHPDGTEAPEDEIDWAWDLVNDLIRLDEQNPDAELIAACNEFLRIQRAFEAACDALPGDMADDDPAWEMLDPASGLEEKIVSLRAQTADGYLARARCEAFFYRPAHRACQDDPEAAREDRFRAACLRDLVQMELAEEGTH